MSSSLVLEVLQSALVAILKITVPLLGISLIVGLVIAVFQAATQIHEQTLTFVPKLFSMAILLLVMGAFIINTLTDLVKYVFDLMIKIT